eukprot:SAG31_NODE_680_length_12881_cov_35.655453_2_plen_87_part_00
MSAMFRDVRLILTARTAQPADAGPPPAGGRSAAGGTTSTCGNLNFNFHGCCLIRVGMPTGTVDELVHVLNLNLVGSYLPRGEHFNF